MEEFKTTDNLKANLGPRLQNGSLPKENSF